MTTTTTTREQMDAAAARGDVDEYHRLLLSQPRVCGTGNDVVPAGHVATFLGYDPETDLCTYKIGPA